MTNIILFGNQPLASWVVDTIQKSNALNLIGVVTEDTNRDFSHHKIDLPALYEYASNNNIPILDDSQLILELEQRPIMGLTVRWPKLIKEDVINKFEHGILNFHGGFLPRWRGLNIPTHVIMEGATHSGATLHYLDKHIDTGPILARQNFEVNSQMTAYDIFLKTQSTLQSLFLDNIDNINLGKEAATNQQIFLNNGEVAQSYSSNHAQGNRSFHFSDEPYILERAARAFEFPGYERAYIEIGNQKIYITPEKSSKVRNNTALSDPFKSNRKKKK